MSIILGIDTGGTYTDGVIVDRVNGKVLCKAKALTTKYDLSIGIAACLESLEFADYKKIKMVCLSTTLATNSVVEGRGAKTGLLTINPAAKGGKWPSDQLCELTGKLDIKGNEMIPLDACEIQKSLYSMKGKVDALAISGYSSVRNPCHELAVKKKSVEILNVPVVCGHELTHSLGYYERTVTAILNAKLISTVEDLVDKTKIILKKMTIEAPIVILKGDGHFMVDTFAEGRPIETILSGPAASVIGATFLTNIQNALVTDLGGTTTDIANITSGNVSINENGARVGGWQTKVRAIDIQTFGLGGDSYLTIEKGSLSFGPMRVIPLCVAASKDLHLIDELQHFSNHRGYGAATIQSFDCFRLLNKPNNVYLTSQDEKILAFLKDGAHSVHYIAEQIGRKIKYLRLDKLMKESLIEKISLTPTDLLHASGEYDQWEKRASETAIAIAARQLGIEVDDFIHKAKEQFINQLTFAIAKSIVIFEGSNSEKGIIDYDILRKGVFHEFGENLEMNLVLKKPIIGLGAPAAAWLPEVSRRLNAELILPENGEVANAIGAAAGNIRESVEVLIKYDPSILKYVVHGPWGKDRFVTIEEAKESARTYICQISEKLAHESDMEKYSVHIAEEIEYEDLNNISKWRLIEIKMKGIITGLPKCVIVENER